MKIPGVYVEIKGDMTHLTNEMKKSRQLVTEQARGMSNALNNSLSDSQIKTSVNNLVSNLGALSRSSHLTGAAFKNIGVDLGSLRSVTGTTDAQFAKLQSRMLETNAARQQENALKGIARAANLSEKEVRDLGRQFGLSKKQIDSVNGSLEASSSKMSALAVASRSLFAVFSVAAMAQMGRTIVAVADQYTLLDSKIKMVSKDSADFAKIQSGLFDMSQRTGTSFSENAMQYSRFALSLQDLNMSSDEMLSMFDTLNKSVVVSGASIQEAASFIQQFRQGMSSGKFAGDEFKAMMESNSYFALQLAKALDTDIDGLYKMKTAGELTTAALREAFPKMSAQISLDFDKVSKTISRAMMELRNAFNDVIAESNRSTGATSNVADSISVLAKTITDNKAAISDIFSGLIKGAGYAVTAIAKVGEAWTHIYMMSDAQAHGKPLGEVFSMSSEELRGWLENNKTMSTGMKDLVAQRDAYLKKVEDYDRALKVRRKLSITEQNDYNVAKAQAENLNSQISAAQKTSKATPAVAFPTVDKPQPPPGNKPPPGNGSGANPLDPYAKLDSSIQSYFSSLDSLTQKEAERTAGLMESMKATNLHIQGLNGIQNASTVAEDSWQRLITLSKEYDETVAKVDTALIEFFDGVSEPAETFSDDMKTAVTGWASGFSASLTDMVFDADASFGSIAESFARMLMQMVLQKGIVEPLLKFAFPTAAVASAQGNVFSGAGISAYSNSIVSKPTVFPFAKGVGLMGEAGSEAIMPLTRMPGGNLGVNATGGAVNNIIINNYSDQAATQTEQGNDTGGMDIEVMIGSLVARETLRHGSPVNRAVRSATGSGTQMIRR